MGLEVEKNIVPTYLNYDLFPAPALALALVLVLIRPKKTKAQTKTVAKLELPLSGGAHPLFSRYLAYEMTNEPLRLARVC